MLENWDDHIGVNIVVVCHTSEPSCRRNVFTDHSDAQPCFSCELDGDSNMFDRFKENLIASKSKYLDR